MEYVHLFIRVKAQFFRLLIIGSGTNDKSLPLCSVVSYCWCFPMNIHKITFSVRRLKTRHLKEAWSDPFSDQSFEEWMDDALTVLQIRHVNYRAFSSILLAFMRFLNLYSVLPVAYPSG